jgi:transposase-like protein
MAKKARKYSVDFKQEAVRRMGQATTIIGLAKELGIRQGDG